MRKRLALVTLLGSLAAAITFSAVAFSHAAPPAPAGSGYHVIKTIPVGGDGGWDYIYVDSDARRVYVSRGTHTIVLDADSYAVVGDIPDTQGVHGIAIASDLGRGFTSNGRSNDVTIFDLKTLKSLGTVKTDANPDAILYEPVTKRVFTFNGRGKNATAINAADGAVLGAIDLRGKPEFAAERLHLCEQRGLLRTSSSRCREPQGTPSLAARAVQIAFRSRYGRCQSPTLFRLR